MNQYFPKPQKPFGGDIKVRVDLSNNATKSDSKKVTGIGTSKLVAESYFTSLKAEIHKLDIDKSKNVQTNSSNLKSKVDKLDIVKLETTPVDLSKLSNVVKNELVKKTKFNAKINNIEDKIPDIGNLATKTIFNTEINEVKTEKPSITNTSLTAVEDKITDVSNLVKKQTITQKLMKLKKKKEKKKLIIVMINTLLLYNLIS